MTFDQMKREQAYLSSERQRVGRPMHAPFLMDGFNQQRAAQQNVNPPDPLGMAGQQGVCRPFENYPRTGGMQPSVEDTPERLEAMRSRGLDDMDDYLNGHGFRWVPKNSEPSASYENHISAKHWEELHPPTVPAYKALWDRLVAHWTWIWCV